MVPGEAGSGAPQGCRLQRLRELNEGESEDILAMFTVQPSFYRVCLCLGLSPVPPLFLLFEHFLACQRVLVVVTLTEGSCPTTCQQHDRCQNKYLRAIARVMHSSGEKSVGSVCVATSQEKSRSDMQVRSKLPQCTIQINPSDLGY